jgi:hypothetical protein
MTVSWNARSQEWDRDPAVEVACPKCGAQIGRYCIVRRPSGHTCNFGNKTLIHPARDQLAIDLGFLQRCSAAIIPEIDRAQMSLL